MQTTTASSRADRGQNFCLPEKDSEYRFSILPVQPKLTVGSPDDPYEREAHAMADQVMRMPEPGFVQRKCAQCVEEEVQRQPEDQDQAGQLKRNLSNSFIQRKCAECEKEEKELQRKPLSHIVTPFFLAKNETTVSDGVANSIQSSKGGGSALDTDSHSFMSSRFGSDFSGVKIHTDSRAIQLNRNLNARAFTVGSDIYFNQGQYNPHSSEGRRLLAHELTHVVQQQGLRSS